MARLTLILTVLTTVVALLGGFRYLMDTINEMRWRKKQTGKWLLLLFFCLTPSNVSAEEIRCQELGSECICSEPLQATAYTQVLDAWFNPNDSTVKPCNGESGSTAAITRVDTTKPPQVGTNAGEVIAEGSPQEIQNNPAVIDAYLGKEAVA